jgi:hypothetical protein
MRTTRSFSNNPAAAISVLIRPGILKPAMKEATIFRQGLVFNAR